MREMTLSQARAAYELGEAKVFTMRQLNQDTAGVIAEINRDGVPAAITKNGRFVAMITPLEGCKVESLVLSREGGLAASLTQRDDEEVRTRSTAEVAAELGLGPVN